MDPRTLYQEYSSLHSEGHHRNPCAISVPGALYDSTIVEIGGVRDNLDHFHRAHWRRDVADSTFCRAAHQILFKSVQQGFLRAQSVYHMLELQQSTSLRQTSQWVMRAVQAAFRRLKVTLIFEMQGERKKVSLCATHNLLTSIRAFLGLIKSCRHTCHILDTMALLCSPLLHKRNMKYLLL